MTKKEAFDEINYFQDEYVGELIRIINSSNYEMMKTINFTSASVFMRGRRKDEKANM